MNGGFPENSVWFELARGSNWRVLSYWKSTLLINFFYNHVFVLACCFFFPRREDGMPDDSFTNALVSSIYICMYYLGYVHFFIDSLSLLF